MHLICLMIPYQYLKGCMICHCHWLSGPQSLSHPPALHLLPPYIHPAGPPCTEALTEIVQWTHIRAPWHNPIIDVVIDPFTIVIVIHLRARPWLWSINAGQAHWFSWPSWMPRRAWVLAWFCTIGIPMLISRSAHTLSPLHLLYWPSHSLTPATHLTMILLHVASLHVLPLLLLLSNLASLSVSSICGYYALLLADGDQYRISRYIRSC